MKSSPITCSAAMSRIWPNIFSQTFYTYYDSAFHLFNVSKTYIERTKFYVTQFVRHSLLDRGIIDYRITESTHTEFLVKTQNE